MNHQKLYDTIIQKTKYENRIKIRKNKKGYVCYERHHINPRCLGGSDEKENLQLVTTKEHYICHKLLTYIYPENRKIVYAFFRMTTSKKFGHINSAKDYAYTKELLNSIPVSKETKEKLSISLTGKSKSPEHCKNISEHHANVSGENGPMYGKYFYDMWVIKYGKEEADKKMQKYKEKQSESHIGKIPTKETIEKITKSNKGKHDHAGIKNSMFGKSHSPESIEKMRLAAKNRKKK